MLRVTMMVTLHSPRPRMVRVTLIIQPDTDFEIKEDCLFFSDDEDDDSVDKMVSLIRDGAHFTKKMFIGGATSADLVASLVQAKIKIQIDRVEGKVDDLRESFDQLQEVVKKHISENSAQLLALQNGFKTILDSIASLSSQSHSRSVEDNPMADAPVADSVRVSRILTETQPQRDHVLRPPSPSRNAPHPVVMLIWGSGGRETLQAEEKPNLKTVMADPNKETNRLDDDEKRVRNGDRPFTKAKRSNCDMLDRNEPQTYASLEKMLHKTIFAIQQLKKKGNTNTYSAPKQHNLKRELVFPDHPDILRTIVEPELAWIVKNLKTDMDSHPADHPDCPARVLIVTAMHLSGKNIVSVDSPVGRLGLTVCYDLRFPKIYQQLRFDQKAQVILVPSAFTTVTGDAHWEILLRSRAIETQCYVIAASQAGKHNEKRESYGDTLIIDPWGSVVGRLPDRFSTGITVADIDFSLLESVRTKMPIDKQRVSIDL
ncbi:hypothetical protein F2Q69_00042403 [Brassica cretica]|uniref:CN hydrolase domain-containing protein n=1 Tax=Brassica cretica TaxID=69181 RepID=A0A8S9NJH3_BRACR|nr:hypothetical protein F2Q69_00042403 [Brassica cretica]